MTYAINATETPEKAIVQHPPLVTFKQSKLRFLFQKVQLLVAAGVMAHIGTLVIVAVYFLAFELNPHATAWWHSTVPNGNLRHDIRDVAEGLLGGLLAQAIVWNHWKGKRVKSDRKRMKAWQAAIAPVLLLVAVLVAATPGFLAAYLADAHLHSLVANAATSTAGPHASLWARTETLWTNDYDKKIMGLFASFFFGRWPVRPFFDRTQLWFAEHYAMKGKTVRWYHLPNFAARVNGVSKADIAKLGERHSVAQTTFTLLAIVAGLGLAGYGYYILTYLAQ